MKLIVAFRSSANVLLSNTNPTQTGLRLNSGPPHGRRLVDALQVPVAVQIAACFFLFFGTSRDVSKKLTKIGYKCAVLRLIYSLGPLNIRNDDKLQNYINELPNSLGNSAEKSPSRETNKHTTKTLQITADYSSPTWSKKKPIIVT